MFNIPGIRSRERTPRGRTMRCYVGWLGRASKHAGHVSHICWIAWAHFGGMHQEAAISALRQSPSSTANHPTLAPVPRAGAAGAAQPGASGARCRPAGSAGCSGSGAGYSRNDAGCGASHHLCSCLLGLAAAGAGEPRAAATAAPATPAPTPEQAAPPPAAGWLPRASPAAAAARLLPRKPCQTEAPHLRRPSCLVRATERVRLQHRHRGCPRAAARTPLPENRRAAAPRATVLLVRRPTLHLPLPGWLPPLDAAGLLLLPTARSSPGLLAQLRASRQRNSRQTLAGLAAAVGLAAERASAGMERKHEYKGQAMCEQQQQQQQQQQQRRRQQRHRQSTCGPNAGHSSAG